MKKELEIPVTIINAGTQVGAGSQPTDEDGAEMTFMDMPSGMTTFEAPIVPEPENTSGMEQAMALSEEILLAMNSYKIGDEAVIFELDTLDEKNKVFMDQLLGDGEVSVQCGGDLNAQIQESVLAGLWRVHYLDDNQKIIRDTMEISHVPRLVSHMTFKGAADYLDIDNLEIPESVYNAPPLLVELSDNMKEFDSKSEPYVINLSLLPHTEEDITFLSDSLGIGPNVILSRGYGNCRISSTKTKNIWWVQYFNSQDTLILNTIEISLVPSVGCAAQEDIDDSAERLNEILSIYR
jgi:hydrogenase-1 operon protein HyaF